MDNNFSSQTQTEKKNNFSKLPPVVVSTKSKKDVDLGNPPDLVSFKITNPIVYIKYWWKKIMSNEGIEVKIKAKPITVFGIALIAFSLAFGLGGIVLPSFFPWIKYDNNQVAAPTATPQPVVLKDTALKGTLAKSGSNPDKFYLITTSTQAVTLEIPDGFNLTTLVGKRILVVGSYNQKEKILKVEDIQNLEVLTKTPIPVPTVVPTQTPDVVNSTDSAEL